MNPIDLKRGMARNGRLGRVFKWNGFRHSHAPLSRLLLTATKPPAGRVVLVNGFDAWAETPSGTLLDFVSTICA